mmetsp:Transcript_12270/g.19803  ORF Transcript_12270/g.19803 Transcript_12270/m.19803 type:complete len:228 (-) Transcript_12270:270-953(-)
MLTVSCTVGSGTNTDWNRRASAASFSIYFRYSARVVAPIRCSSPRARAGLSILDASIAPSAAPAPTSVCSSSMKRMTLPSAAVTSFRTLLSLSSNSPRNLAPATRAPRSNSITRLFLILSGTSLFTIRCAKPSTIAVFPTPGSPINTGLFFVRLANTCMVLRIISSLPITGSSFPFLAASVKSRPYFLRLSPCGMLSGFTHGCRGAPPPPPPPEPIGPTEKSRTLLC